MAPKKCRTNIICPNCQKVYSLQNSELKRRLLRSVTGRIFCSRICYFSFSKNYIEVI